MFIVRKTINVYKSAGYKQSLTSTVQYSTVQYSTVQYSTVQYSSVQYCSVQYSSVQCITKRNTTLDSGVYLYLSAMSLCWIQTLEE